MNHIRKRIRTILLSAASVLCFSIPAWAAETAPKQVVVELEAVSEEKEHYRANEQVDYTLTMKNKLGPSWLRVKFTFTGKHVDRTFTDQNLNIQSDWVKRGDYFYYTKKAEAYTDYIVVKGIRIPDAVPTGENASVTISVYGEAVQYEGFHPDFDSGEPWKGAEIQHTSNISDSASYRSSGGSSSRPVTLYSSPQERGNPMEGKWELVNAENHIWKYKNSSGNYVKNG